MLKNHPKFKLVDIDSSTEVESKYTRMNLSRSKKKESNSESSMSDPEKILKVLANTDEDSNDSENKYMKRILLKEFKIKQFENEKGLDKTRNNK